MNSESIDTIIRKNPKLRSKREKLDAMADGAYCLHGSWGFGRIKNFDSASGKLVIDFEGKQGHKMDPAFCVDKIEVLSTDNLLVRYRIDRENLEKEMKEAPAEFVAKYLEKKPDNSASLIELENLLKQLFGFKMVNFENLPELDFEKQNKAIEKVYRAWWNKAKEALFRDQRIACPKTKSDSYVLRAKEEEMKPEEEVLQEYFLNRDPKKKILLAERLYKVATADSVEEIKSELPKIKDELTEAIKTARSLNDADRLHGIWVRNNLVRYLYPGEESKVEEIAPRSKDIIATCVERDPNGLNVLAKDLPSSYLERFLDLLTRIYTTDWRDKIIDLLKNSEGRFTKECVDFLLSWDESKESHFVKGAEISDDGKSISSRDLIKQSFKRWLEEQTLRGAVILWIVKSRHESKYADILEDLINQELLSAMLAAIDDESLQRETIVTTARIPLADALSEDRDLVKDMLKNSTAETARDLAQTLLLNQGFEELNKKSILARIIKMFPAVQSLVSTKAEAKEKRVFVSAWSMQARREELEEIVKNLLPESKKAIEAARELGDLRENSEYKMAREHDETLSARRAQLERELAMADVIDFTDATEKAVAIGSVVDLETDKGESLTCTILGAWDSDTQKNIFSYRTPLGQAILDKKVGDTAQTNINGHVTLWTVKKIGRYVDIAK